MSMNDRPFNTPFELSLHIVMLLDSVQAAFSQSKGSQLMISSPHMRRTLALKESR